MNAEHSTRELSPGQLDLRRLEQERAAKPQEPVWQLLARLGWIPPSTAAALRADIQQLKPATAVAADIKAGDKILLEVAGLKVIKVEQNYEFLVFTLEDGTRTRRHRMDTVWIPKT